MNNPFKKKPAADYSAVIRGARNRQRKHMGHWWQWAIVGVVVLALSGAGFAAWAYFHLQGEVQVHLKTVTQQKDQAKSFNALLVGSDSRTGLTPAQQLKLGANAVPGRRADTIILAHVDPQTNEVTMVQFPRDLYVPIHGRGKDKINSAIEPGGPSNLIATIKDLTGLKINHYVQVNLDGFRELVNAIGGVDVCVPQKIPFDTHTGLQVTKPGMIHFGGDEALRFVRAREVFANGDFTRIQNQQRFLQAAIAKGTQKSTLFNPAKVTGIYKAVGRNLRIDDYTSLRDSSRLAQRFRSFDPRHYQAYTVPNLGAKQITLPSGGISDIVAPDWRGMHVMFRAIARGRSPAQADGVPNVDPSTIGVGVYNGTFQAGIAHSAAVALVSAASIRIAEVGNAAHFGYKRTVIRYRPGAKKKAEYIAAAVPGSKVEAGKTHNSVDVAVIVGKHFKTTKVVQLVPIPLPQPAAPPPVCRRQGALGHGP
ncbi:MAG: LCP family protein [Actinomycetota bacterium]|nr:LCP family protein [Actinomycetota bacterium]